MILQEIGKAWNHEKKLSITKKPKLITNAIDKK